MKFVDALKMMHEGKAVKNSLVKKVYYFMHNDIIFVRRINGDSTAYWLPSMGTVEMTLDPWEEFSPLLSSSQGEKIIDDKAYDLFIKSLSTNYEKE